MKRGTGITCLCLLFAWLAGSAGSEEPAVATLGMPAVVVEGSNPGFKARIFILASDRDEVEASGTMARNIAERMSCHKTSTPIQNQGLAKIGDCG